MTNNKKEMTEKEFYEKQDNLIRDLNKYILEKKYKGYNNDFVLRIKNILQSYTYENRLHSKGVLGRIIVDQSPDLTDPLFNALVKFDHEI